MTGTGRRAVLAGAIGLGAGAALTACGGADDEATSGAPTAEDPASGGGPTTTAPGGGATTGPGAGALASVADIPVGGGKIFTAEQVVITQPVPGTFKAFSAACTHQGCMVAAVTDGVIRCACHGSEFSAADGSVKAGPASAPLPARTIKMDGDAISLG